MPVYSHACPLAGQLAHLPVHPLTYLHACQPTCLLLCPSGRDLLICPSAGGLLVHLLVCLFLLTCEPICLPTDPLTFRSTHHRPACAQSSLLPYALHNKFSYSSLSKFMYKDVCTHPSKAVLAHNVFAVPPCRLCVRCELAMTPRTKCAGRCGNVTWQSFIHLPLLEDNWRWYHRSEAKSQCCRFTQLVDAKMPGLLGRSPLESSPQDRRVVATAGSSTEEGRTPS